MRAFLRVLLAAVAIGGVSVLEPVMSAQVADTTPPTIITVLSRVANANGWHRADVRVTFRCADAGSRVASCPASVLVSTEGAGQVISGTAYDRAGNSASTSVTINLDKTAPVVTGQVTPDAPASGWHTTPVTVSFAATDAGSGVAPGTLTAPVTLVSERTNSTVRGRATDLAGNVGTVSVTGINIDTRAPRGTVAFNPATSSAGYRIGPVTATFTCTDVRSGVESCPAPQTFTTDGRDQVVMATVVDRAGHSTTVTRTLHVDSTPPALVIAAPTTTEIDADTFTIQGTVTDALSGMATFTADGVAVRRRSGGAFTVGPIPLPESGAAVVLRAADRAGNVVERTVSVTRPAPDPDPEPEPEPVVNLVADPQFTLGVSGFFPQDDTSTVAQTTEAPLEGAHSLRVTTNGYGNNVWWQYTFTGGRASALLVSAHLRMDVDSSSDLQWCAMAYYVDGTMQNVCTPVSGAAGDKGVVTTTITLDESRPLSTVAIRMSQEGASPLAFTLDAATVNLTVVEMPPTGGGGSGGGSGGGGGGGGGSEPPPPGTNPCQVSPTTLYVPRTYAVPTARPFISLSSYTQGSATRPEAVRLLTAAAQAVAGSPAYAYSATHSLLAWEISGNEAYLLDAVARVEQIVTEAEAAIAGGGRPAVAGDSYLEVGWYLEQIALTYDRAYDRLTPEQRQRWATFAEQTLYNLWNPQQATWGGVLYQWSGWSICDPGNNYHFSFLRATMLWALASRNDSWFTFLQTQKFGPLVDYYAALPGGGTREGTGYGTALNSLFGTLLIWRDSTGEDLSAVSPHTRETIDYWVHATVPTLDRFAPIGDLSRSSVPELYDYHENLVHQAVVLNPGTPEAARGTWWLQQNSVNGVAHLFNIAGDLLPLPDVPVPPLARVHHSPGAGAFFARTAWNADAWWMSMIAGQFDQSHAHQDQGSFTLFRRDWLAVTNNIWSYSGINQDVPVHNTLRFVRADGTVVPQTRSEVVASSLSWSEDAVGIRAVATLDNAYYANRTTVQAWTRSTLLSTSGLRVTDTCTVATGVTAVFQVHVPVAPTIQVDGSVRAGSLRIHSRLPVNITIVPMDATQYSRGYRVDLTPVGGCAHDVDLEWVEDALYSPDMALVSSTDIQAAAARIAGDVRRTPVLDLSDVAGCSLLLKCEHHQPGGAFKIRGASNMLGTLSPEALARGVVTYSSGNHGQAVALAAHRRGVPAVIVMPTTAPAIKIAGVKRWGGEVILEGTTSADRRVRAEHEVATRGLTMVPPFDHEAIVAGQGTLGLEILEQVPTVGTVVVPVGGGGLLAGVAAAIKQARPDVVVVGVEPAGAPKMSRSLAAGHPITLDSVKSVADGLMPVRPGDVTFAHAQRFVDAVITVEDAQIARAALWLFHEAKQVVEPSGAATTAAILWPGADSPLRNPRGPVVAVVSGGNVAPETLVALGQA